MEMGLCCGFETGISISSTTRYIKCDPCCHNPVGECYMQVYNSLSHCNNHNNETDGGNAKLVAHRPLNQKFYREVHIDETVCWDVSISAQGLHGHIVILNQGG